MNIAQGGKKQTTAKEENNTAFVDLLIRVKLKHRLY